MKKVTITRIKNGEQVVVLTCQTTPEGAIVFEGDKNMILDFQKNGITDYSSRPHRKVYIDEAEKFMEQIHLNFRTPYTSATEPEEI